MGKHSNLIFVDGRRPHHRQRAPRQRADLLRARGSARPALRASARPRQAPLGPGARRTRSRRGCATRAARLARLISANISGMSAQTARELAFRACGNEDAHIERMRPGRCVRLHRAVVAAHSCRRFAPAVLIWCRRAARGRRGLSLTAAARTLRPSAFPSISAGDGCVLSVARPRRAHFSRSSAAIHRMLKTNIERCERKLALQREALLSSAAHG